MTNAMVLVCSQRPREFNALLRDPEQRSARRAVAIPPPGFEYGEARRRYVEAFGSTQVMNNYLKVAVFGLTVLALALVGLVVLTQRTYAHVKPLVIRIDEVGRATATSYDRLTYTPQAPELRYFLTQFVVWDPLESTCRHASLSIL